MKPASPEQLSAYLARKLAPAYLISGDEPLQVGEAADNIRAAARRHGFESRETLFVEPGFDWNRLGMSNASLSLFAEKKILELRLPGGKPGVQGAAAITDCLDSLTQDTLLLVIAGKVDARVEWVRHFARKGMHVVVGEIRPEHLPAWISRRMRRSGLSCPREAAVLLAERVEGNLLAAAQEVEKLRLWHGEGEVTLEQVKRAVADSARFDAFGLCDSVLAGDAARAVRMIDGMQAEGAAAPLLVWSLQRALHDVLSVYGLMGGRRDVRSAVKAARIWPPDRRETVRMAVERLDRGSALAMLEQVTAIDRAAKGQGPGAPWDMLRELAGAIAGAEVVMSLPALRRAI